MIGKKLALCSLVAALSSASCKTTINYDPIKNKGYDKNEPILKAPDQGFDSIDDYIDKKKFPHLMDATYLIISESQYESPSGDIETLHSLGSSFLLSDVKERTYLGTANHVVSNEDEIFDFFGGKYTKKSEQFYLLEHRQVIILHKALKILTEQSEEEMFYRQDNGEKKALDYVVKTSETMKTLLSIIKPRKVRVDAGNKEIDAAIISVEDLAHVPIIYKIGDPSQLKEQNLVFDTGYPLGLFKTLSSGKVMAVNDSYIMDNPESKFIFSAPISPGNSGGPIFVSQKGEFKLIGINKAMYTRGSSLFVGVKIDSISKVFKGDSITCSEGWKCNTSLPYEIRL